MSGRRTVPDPDVLGYNPGKAELAETEAAALDANIDISKRAQEHLREEKFRDLFARSMRVLIGATFVMTVGAVIAFGWHYLMPEQRHWLSNDQLTAIKTFLFSSAVVGLMLSYLQKRL